MLHYDQVFGGVFERRESKCLEYYETSSLFENSEFDSYNKNDMKDKANDLVRLHKAVQEKLKTASYSKQIQILTLVPDELS